MDAAAEIWARFGSIYGSLARAPEEGCPDGFRPALESLKQVQRAMAAEGRQITLLGAAGTGKTSLFGALLGVQPFQANAAGTVHPVVRAGHAEVPRAEVARSGSEEDIASEISFEALPRVVQRGPGEVEEIRVQVPSPLLKNGWSLVDTPSGGEGDAFRELARSDLAIVVLAADQILSAVERRLVRRVQRALGGNALFVINRVDLLTGEEVADVVEWARHALRDTGNGVVGAPAVFAVSTRDLPRAGEGLEALRAVLDRVTSSSFGDQVVALSRLTHLGAAIQSLRFAAVEARNDVSTSSENLRLAAETRNRDQRAARISAIGDARRTLQARSEALEPLLDRFVADSLDTLRRELAEEREIPSEVPYRESLDFLGSALADEVQLAGVQAGVSTPAVDLGSWSFHAELDLPWRAANKLPGQLGGILTRPLDGGVAGREAGKSLGKWIGSNVLRVDVEKEAVKRGRDRLELALPSLGREIRRQIGKADAVLQEAQRYYESWDPEPVALDDLARAERYFESLLEWCDGVLSEVEAGT